MKHPLTQYVTDTCSSDVNTLVCVWNELRRGICNWEGKILPREIRDIGNLIIMDHVDEMPWIGGVRKEQLTFFLFQRIWELAWGILVVFGGFLLKKVVSIVCCV